jgi:hypothetical protein
MHTHTHTKYISNLPRNTTQCSCVCSITVHAILQYKANLDLLLCALFLSTLFCRNSQARRPTRHSMGFIFVVKEPVCLPIHYSFNVVVITLTPRARHDLMETTRAMTRHGSDDLLSVNNTTTLCPLCLLLYPMLPFIFVFIHLSKSPYPLQ